MRLLVCGDRNWKDYGYILYKINKLHQQVPIEVIIEGEARGADTMARLAALHLGIPYLPFPADWEKYGKAAGPIRNQQMLDEGKPTLVYAFHNDILTSKGTKHMVSIAKKAGITTHVFTYQEGGY